MGLPEATAAYDEKQAPVSLGLGVQSLGWVHHQTAVLRFDVRLGNGQVDLVNERFPLPPRDFGVQDRFHSYCNSVGHQQADLDEKVKDRTPKIECVRALVALHTKCMVASGTPAF